MNVLSLFDGMACGMLAMKAAGVNVDRYVAYEIDKYAIKVATHNFPDIEEKGDVFTADFTQYEGIDWLIGGSPCTYWSIAQTKNRETTASGLGWDLFSQYVRALHEARPKFFIYENNKSMSKNIRDMIRKTFGFEEICINSALVSAQNRQRYYWVGKRNEDGTYSKVDVKQPKDRGILLKDVLDQGVGVNTTADNKAQTMKRQYHFTSTCNICCYKSTYGASGAAEPVSVRPRGREEGCKYEARNDGIAGAITAGRPTELAEPVRVGTYPGSKCPECDSKQYRIYDTNGKAVTQCGQGGGLGAKTGLYAVPVHEGETGKSNVQLPFKSYAIAVEWDGVGNPTKAVSGADGKTYTVYKVSNGQITIKGKQYPIKLADGYWIIRKLTVSECKRLQTVPDWYDMSCISDTRCYQCLGNGWTIEIIKHLINCCLK